MLNVKMDDKGIKDLVNTFRHAPKKVPVALNMWVNKAAFTTRANALANLESDGTIRSPAFVKSRMRVQKAKGVSLVGSFSEVGSVKAERFTGWAEQEGIKPSTRKKTITLMARGGTKGKRVAPRMRMRKGKVRPNPNDYKGRSANRRAQVMLHTMIKERKRHIFKLFGHSKLKPGLYKFGSGSLKKRQLVPIQLFGRKPKKTKRTNWMRRAVNQYLRQLDKKAVWRDIIKRVGLFKRRGR